MFFPLFIVGAGLLLWLAIFFGGSGIPSEVPGWAERFPWIPFAEGLSMSRASTRSGIILVNEQYLQISTVIKSRIPRQVALRFNHSPTINQWKLHAQSTRPRWWEILIPIFQCRYHFNVPLIVFTHWPTKNVTSFHCQFHCQSTNPIWWNVFISNVIFKPWMTLEIMIRQAWDANRGPDWKLPLRVSCALERFDTVKSLIRAINP